MSKLINKSTETYRVDTEEEVVEFHEELRSDNSYDLIKFQWVHKTTKNDDYFVVTATKKYYELEEQE